MKNDPVASFFGPILRPAKGSVVVSRQYSS